MHGHNLAGMRGLPGATLAVSILALVLFSVSGCPVTETIMAERERATYADTPECRAMRASIVSPSVTIEAKARLDKLYRTRCTS